MKKAFRIGAVVMLISLFAAAASAAEWNFYGSARVKTFIEDTDNPGATPDTKNFDMGLQSNSRIGAKVAVGDSLTGRFEYGAKDGSANIRHLFGEWDFGGGKFLVGQTDTPLNNSMSNKVYGTDENLDSYGGIDGGRRAMIRLSFGGIEIAAVEPNTDAQGVAGGTTEVKLPKVEANYTMSFDNAYIYVGGGYQTYELTNPANSIAYDVDSYILAAAGRMDISAFYMGADFWYGQNVGAYGYSCAADGDAIVSGGQLMDNNAMGWLLVGGMKLSDTFSFEAGYGYTEAEPDSPAFQKDKAVSYYVQSTITLASGVFFVPEIGIEDEKNDNTGTEESETLYYGIKWQINF